MSWHLDPALVDRYASGGLDPAGALSVEAHMELCSSCQGLVAGHVPSRRLERIWAEVVDELDRPQPGAVERLLGWLGLPDHVARLLAATPSLTTSWLLALGVVLGFAVLAARVAPPGGTLLFLVVAPLLPLAGVAAAYGPGVDPTYEVAVAAPLRGSRLLLLRAVAVLTVSFTFTVVAALALPVLDWTLAAWVLPSMALTLLALAAATAVEPLWAAGAVAVMWVVAVLLVEQLSAVPLTAFRAGSQLVALFVVTTSAALLAGRLERFDRHQAL